MLENYIERNIFRKVYLCEQLFEFQEIDIEQTAISLRVTTPTILHDLESLAEGNTLLQYARFREDKEGDFGRIRRQQQVIKAISQQLKDVTSIFKLPKAVGKLLGSIQTILNLFL
ncbi:hypothetical protein EfmAA96_14910 [Enterococcus faecium]|nr:hypothetical protein EfmAA96_14910 [Enterococcus faecium]